MEVLEHDHDRLAICELREEAEQMLEEPALAGRVNGPEGGVGGGLEFGDHATELSSAVARECEEFPVVDRQRQSPEGFDDCPERQPLATDRQARTFEDADAHPLRTALQLPREARFADTGLALEEHEPRLSVARLREGGDDALELAFPPDEDRARDPGGHGAFWIVRPALRHLRLSPGSEIRSPQPKSAVRRNEVSRELSLDPMRGMAESASLPVS